MHRVRNETLMSRRMSELWRFAENAVPLWRKENFARTVVPLSDQRIVRLRLLLSLICPENRIMKKIVLGAVVLAVAIFAVSRFASMSVEPCDWCGNSPSVAYKMSDDSYSYVCKDCSKKCAWCGEKATKHYENLAGMMVFVCDDCYEELQ